MAKVGRTKRVRRSVAPPPPLPRSRPRAVQEQSRHKRPFDFDEMMRRLRVATKPYTPAAMFQLADEGYGSVFQILVACIVSIRTYEEVTLPTSRKLFEQAATAKEIAALSERQIDDLIHACTFHEPKARQIRQIAIE